MKSVIVTGSFGFLGQYISREFLSKGWCVMGVDKRRTEPDIFPHLKLTEHYILGIGSEQFESLLEQHKPDLIVHAAGSASVPNSINNPANDFNDSIELVFHILDSIRCISPQTRFLFLSSAAVYGNPLHLPVKETEEFQPISPYGYHKMICELIIREYVSIFHILACTARIFSAYGPGLKRQVVWDICQKALNNPSIELSGTGNESRDFIHADDIALAIRLIADNGSFTGASYNVANGREICIADVVKVITSSLQKDYVVNFNGLVRSGDPFRWSADISELNHLGYQQKIPFDEGIRDYTQWFLTQSNYC